MSGAVAKVGVKSRCALHGSSSSGKWDGSDGSFEGRLEIVGQDLTEPSAADLRIEVDDAPGSPSRPTPRHNFDLYGHTRPGGCIHRANRASAPFGWGTTSAF